MTEEARQRVVVELDHDEAVVLYEYLSRKDNLEPDEFDEEFEDVAEDLVLGRVCDLLAAQLEDQVSDQPFESLDEARQRIRDAAQ